jgi:hypothetical protein
VPARRRYPSSNGRAIIPQPGGKEKVAAEGVRER